MMTTSGGSTKRSVLTPTVCKATIFPPMYSVPPGLTQTEAQIMPPQQGMMPKVPQQSGTCMVQQQQSGMPEPLPANGAPGPQQHNDIAIGQQCDKPTERPGRNSSMERQNSVFSSRQLNGMTKATQQGAVPMLPQPCWTPMLSQQPDMSLVRRRPSYTQQAKAYQLALKKALTFGVLGDDRYGSLDLNKKAVCTL